MALQTISLNSLFSSTTKIQMHIAEQNEMCVVHFEMFEKLMKLLKRRMPRFEGALLENFADEEVNEYERFLNKIYRYNSAADLFTKTDQCHTQWSNAASVYVLDIIEAFVDLLSLSKDIADTLSIVTHWNSTNTFVENLYDVYLCILRKTDCTSKKWIYKHEAHVWWSIFVILLHITTGKVEEVRVIVDRSKEKKTLDDVFERYKHLCSWLGIESANVNVLHNVHMTSVERYDFSIFNANIAHPKELDYIVFKSKIGSIVASMSRLHKKYSRFLKLVERIDSIYFYQIIYRANNFEHPISFAAKCNTLDIELANPDDRINLCAYAMLDALQSAIDFSTSFEKSSKWATSIGMMIALDEMNLKALVNDIGEYLKNNDQVGKPLTELLNRLIAATEVMRKSTNMNEIIDCSKDDEHVDLLNAWKAYFEWKIKKEKRKPQVLNNLYFKAFALTKAFIFLINRQSELAVPKYSPTTDQSLISLKAASSAVFTQTELNVHSKGWDFLEEDIMNLFMHRIENEYPQGRLKFNKMPLQFRRYMLCYVLLAGVKPRNAFDHLFELLRSNASKSMHVEHTEANSTNTDDGAIAAAPPTDKSNEPISDNFLFDLSKVEKVTIYRVKDRGEDNLELDDLFGTKRTQDLSLVKKEKTIKLEKSIRNTGLGGDEDDDDNNDPNKNEQD